jgi:hypothetical protein
LRSSGEERAIISRSKGADLASAHKPGSRVHSAKTVIKHTIDGALILVPLVVMTYFLLRPDAFNAFLAYVFRIKH